MICSDFHLHCSYSPDSDSSMEEMIRAAIGLGLKRMCLTDHQDCLLYTSIPVLWKILSTGRPI